MEEHPRASLHIHALQRKQIASVCVQEVRRSFQNVQFKMYGFSLSDIFTGYI